MSGRRKKNGRPRVLVVTSSFPSRADDETAGYIRDFARELAREFSVTVLGPPDPDAGDPGDEPFELERSPAVLPGRWNPLRATADLNQLARGGLSGWGRALVPLTVFGFTVLRLARHADLVCSHWLVPSGLAGALAARVFRKPHIVVEHSGGVHFLRRATLGKSIARFVIGSADRVVAVSDDLRNKLTSLVKNARGVEVIPMGFRSGLTASDAEVATSEVTRRDVVFIGRLVGIKGVDVLLHAMKEMDGVRLTVAGDGLERAKLEDLAGRLCVDAEFLGAIGAERRGSLLRTAAVVAVPSIVDSGRTEGTPVACLEAMAAGCPVVASRTGGLAELIKDGENGLLFEAGDAIELRRRLKTVLDDRDLGLRLGEAARRSVESLDWDAVGARYRSLISAVIEEREWSEHPGRVPARNH